MGNDTHSLPQAAIDAISARLAALPDLRLPAQLQSGASEQRKKEYLQALLLHDPGEWCWCERTRRCMTCAELLFVPALLQLVGKGLVAEWSNPKKLALTEMVG